MTNNIFFFCVQGSLVNVTNRDKLDIETKSYILINSFRKYHNDKIIAMIPDYVKNTDYDISIKTKEFYNDNNINIIYFNNPLLNEDTIKNKPILLFNKIYAFKYINLLYNDLLNNKNKFIFCDTDLYFNEKLIITEDILNSNFAAVLSDTEDGYNDKLIEKYKLNISLNRYLSLNNKFEYKFPYFNSGLFIFNINNQLADLWIEYSNNLLKYNDKDIYPLEEQISLSIAINKISNINLLILDRTYNYSIHILKTDSKDSKIIHYHNENLQIYNSTYPKTIY